MRTWGFALAVLGLLAGSAAAQELSNDGFVTGQQVGFQAGFVAGEIGASDFVAPQAGMRLDAVHLLFGGASSTQTITVRVYDATAATTAPGAELYSGDFQLTGSNTVIHTIDLTGESITVPTRFRVGIQFSHAGLPCIARDNDGTIAAAFNFINANLGTGFMWFRSQTLGLTGDWVIRALVSAPVPVDAAVDALPVDADVPPDAAITDGPIDAGLDTPGDALPLIDAPTVDAPAADAPLADAAAPDASSGACQGNGECATGSYCDLATHACTFDCRNDSDCGGDHCNTLGQCVAEQHASGCCQTGGSPRAPLGAIALGVLVALGLRRRIRRVNAAADRPSPR